MNNIKISVIIPCYNVASFLPRLIDSLKNQTLQELEYIFINDGSVDDTVKIIREYEAQDDRVVLIDKLNEGVSKARNDALDIAHGEYIYFLDGDDWLDYTWCEEMYDLVFAEDIDILVFNFCRVYDVRKEYFDLGIDEGIYTQQQFIENLKEFPISPKLYKRSIINNLRFKQDVLVGEVFTFFIGALAITQKIKVTKKCFYNYYCNFSSATQKPRLKADLTIVNALEIMDEYTKKYNIDIKQYYCFVSTICKLLNSFAFNKYLKNCVDYETMKIIIDNVYKVDISKKYLSLFIKQTSYLNLKWFYVFGLRYVPYICYFVLYPIFKLKKLL